MNKARQRSWPALLVAGAGLLIFGACTTGVPSSDSLATMAAVAPTFAATAPTVAAGAQSAVSSAQTALPGAQATAQAAATLVAGVQLVAHQLQLLLGGSNVQVTLEPPNVPNDQVQQVSITGTDTSGNLSKLDQPSRDAAAQGALVVMAQLYPSAAISLSIDAPDGSPLLTATRPPSS